jgi:protein-S-isoprenylcysteine O-methyltransferase Ste14
MPAIAFTTFVAYVVLFVIGQQITGKLRGAHNIAPHYADPGIFGVMISSLVMIMISLVAFPLTILTLKHQEVRDLPIIIGGAFALAGLTLSLWAQWALGPNWVGGIGTQKKHQLVANGPYRFIRHPMYAGMLVSTIGVGVLSWNIFILVACLNFSGAFAIRAISEERVLSQKLGKRYAAYKSRTGMFIPRLSHNR